MLNNQMVAILMIVGPRQRFNREALHKNPALAHRTHASFRCTVHLYVSSLYSAAEISHFRLVVFGWKFHVLSFYLGFGRLRASLWPHAA